MPITTRYVPETGIFETLFYGDVNDDDYIKAYSPFFEAGVVPQDSLEVQIFESNAVVNLTSNGIRALIDLAKPYYTGDEIARVAIVSHGPDVEALAKHYVQLSQVLGKSAQEMRVFDAVSKAMIWLLGHAHAEHL